MNALRIAKHHFGFTQTAICCLSLSLLGGCQDELHEGDEGQVVGKKSQESSHAAGARGFDGGTRGFAVLALPEVYPGRADQGIRRVRAERLVWSLGFHRLRATWLTPD